MTGRCLIGQTRLPTRQQRRILNLVPPVAAISSPKAGDTGRALNWVKRGQNLTHGATFSGVASSLPWAPGGHVVKRVGSDVAADFIQRLA